MSNLLPLWRIRLGEMIHDFVGERKNQSRFRTSDSILAGILTLPAPDRFALARALVADMPDVVVVRDVGIEPGGHFDAQIERAAGWNACRAAMLANGEKNDDTQ